MNKLPNLIYCLLLLFTSTVVWSHPDNNTSTALTKATLMADLNLSSQAEVDAYTPLGVHTGDLIISGSDITNLSSLTGLTEVTGRLAITDSPQLSDLSGLNNLQRVGTILTIANNGLTDISALSNLTTVGAEIYLIENNQLSDLTGLENLQSDLLTLFILQNDQLTNIDALAGLTQVEDEIQVSNNPLLTNLDGLANLDGFCAEIFFENNASMANIDGIGGLEQISHLSIVNQEQLVNLDGLSNFDFTFNNTLLIADNDALTNIDGISNVSVSNRLIIAENPNLAMCCGALNTLTTRPPVNITIENNLPDCNSATEILNNCGTPGCNGPFIINTQADLAALAGCTTVFGNLTISGADINDLSVLNDLEVVTGDFTLENLTLNTLSGLENLTTIDGAFGVNNCGSLTNFQGLNGLLNIGKTLAIVENDNLINTDGLDQLFGSLESFVLFDNDALVDFSSFSISQIMEGVFISANNQLTNLDPLISLSGSIPRYFDIENNPSLTDLSGLQNISSVQDLRIIGNDVLTSLSGLENISGVLRSLIIVFNGQLNDISALSNITSTTTLAVVDNPLLDDCCGVSQILVHPTPPNNPSISGNLAGCASESALLLACGFPACNNSVVFNSQAELDAWITCDTLFGDLELNGDDITDLSPLAGLQVITGGLEIDQCTNLPSLTGLENLTTVGSTLLILQASSVTNLDPLSNLTSVGLNLEIVGNDQLTSIDGLQNLSGTLNDLVIFSNNALTNINNFGNLEILRSVNINSNDLLANMDGLSNISGNIESLSVEFNPALTSLLSLQNFAVREEVFLIGNSSIQSLAGLEGIQDSLTTLLVILNDQLTDIEALENITHLQTLSIIDNVQLNECCTVVDFLVNNTIDVLTIRGNQADCASETAIISACTNIDGPADLELTLATSTFSDLFIYQFYDFQLTVTNQGEGQVNTAMVDFPVPSGMAFTKINSLNGAFYDSYNGKLRLREPLPPNASITLDIRLFSLTESIPVNLYAQVISSDKPDPDSSPGNGTCCTPNEDDEAALTILPEGMVLQEADIELSGTIDKTAVNNGDTVTINLTVTNHGPDPASAVKIAYDATYNTRVRYVFNSTTSTGGDARLFPFWFIGEILPGISYTLTVKYAILDLAQPMPLFFEVVESIPDDPDSTPGNGVGKVASEDDEVAFVLQPIGVTDTDPPVPTLTTPKINVTAPFSVTINFNEVISGLALTDFAINNATLSNLVGSGNAYSVLVTPIDVGQITMSLPAAAVQDNAGNNNIASNELQLNYTEPGTPIGPDLELSITANRQSAPIYNNVVYTITLSNTGLVAADNIIVDLVPPAELPFVSSELTSGTYDVFTSQWILSTLAANSSVSFNLTLFTLAEENVPLTLYGQVIQASPNDDDSTPANWTCTPTGVLGCIPVEDDEASITINVNQPQGNPTVVLSTASTTVSGSFDVTINFSTDVTGLEASDFSVSNGSATALSGSGDSYTLSVTPNFPGQLSIALPANRAQDNNANGNLASNQLIINYTAPSGNDTDLELTFSSTEVDFNIYDFLVFTLTVENKSAVAATNVVISYPKPANTAFTDQLISKGTYNDYTGSWQIGNIPAGGSAILEVTWFTLSDTIDITAYAQVQSASPPDVDSSPGNGTCCVPVEDDEAAITVSPATNNANIRQQYTAVSNKGKTIQFLPPFPNPVMDRLTLPFYVPEATELRMQLVTLTGKILARYTFQLTEGYQQRSIDFQAYEAGVYFLLPEVDGKRRPMKVVKVW